MWSGILKFNLQILNTVHACSAQMQILSRKLQHIVFEAYSLEKLQCNRISKLTHEIIS